MVSRCAWNLVLAAQVFLSNPGIGAVVSPSPSASSPRLPEQSFRTFRNILPSPLLINLKPLTTTGYNPDSQNCRTTELWLEIWQVEHWKKEIKETKAKAVVVWLQRSNPHSLSSLVFSSPAQKHLDLAPSNVPSIGVFA